MLMYLLVKQDFIIRI